MNREINALIIEDSPDDLELYSRLLKKNHTVEIMHFSSAINAIDALSKNKNHGFDIVLLDYNMPGLNGLDFLEKIKSMDIELNAPVIILTGEGNEDIAVKFMHLNVANYLNKRSVTADLLKETIDGARAKFNDIKQKKLQQQELLMFAHTLAHDLKNPMNRINTYAKLAEKSPDKCKKFIQYIVEDSDYLKDFIDKLLMYAQYGRGIDKMTSIKLDTILKKVIGVLEVLIKQKNATIDFKLDNLQINGSEIALIQLFQNLITNSIKYCKNTPNIHITYEEMQNCTKVFVKDNGIGIPKELAEKVFQPYFRINHKVEEQGTGLGLAIVKTILEQHNAEVAISNANEGGTIFEIIFPKALLTQPHQVANKS